MSRDPEHFTVDVGYRDPAKPMDELPDDVADVPFSEKRTEWLMSIGRWERT